jgi:hypothetical protein
MKSIGMLSMVALFALVMEGSASTLASTFGEEDEGWGGEGEAI